MTHTLGAHFGAHPTHLQAVEQTVSEKSTKTVKKPAIKNDMRTEYKRSDFGVMERGKFHEFAVQATKAVVLRPEIAKAFPTSAR